jgi:hypothetical protein
MGGEPIGSFERFSVSFSRNAERIREILFARGPEVKEILWGGTDVEVSISHVELYQANILEALGFEIYSLEDLNQPVTITELQTLPPGQGFRAVYYLDCVATAMSKSVDTGTVRVVEEMTFACRTVRGERF